VCSNEAVVVRAQLLKLIGERKGEQHVGAGLQGQVQIGLLGDLRAQRIDDRQPAALSHRGADLAHQMQIGDGCIVAPHDVERGVRRRLRSDAGYRTIGARPGLAAHPAAQGPAIELAGAQPMEEAQRHAVHRQHAVRARIVQRHHRLRAEALDHRRHASMNLVEGFVPADLLEPARATRPRAPQRPVQPAGAVCELGAVTRYLVADDPFRVRQRVRAAHLYDAVSLHLHDETAGVRTVEGTDAGVFQDRHDRLQNDVGHSVGAGGSAKEPIFA